MRCDIFASKLISFRVRRAIAEKQDEPWLVVSVAVSDLDEANTIRIEKLSSLNNTEYKRSCSRIFTQDRLAQA